MMHADDIPIGWMRGARARSAVRPGRPHEWIAWCRSLAALADIGGDIDQTSVGSGRGRGYSSIDEVSPDSPSILNILTLEKI